MKLTILVADDDPELTELYQNYLQRFGYRILSASEGVACAKALRNGCPDVIVASIDMQWENPNGLADMLRQQSAKRQDPSVILTGCTADENVAALREEPCVFRYLRKPFLMGRLLDCIRALETERSSETQSIPHSAHSPVAPALAQI